MRPISVRFQCFGPYMTEQRVDFEALREKGIFLINGETGAGKTTILDAMCYALYGESSGGTRGELEAMRCKNAGKGDMTFVEFVFEVGGQRYRFYRELRYARKNLNENYEYGVWLSDTWVPLDANHVKKNMNAKAKDLIGLTSDQFRQVIILPQGKFEELLVSDSTDKEEILSTLFHMEQWERLLDKLRLTVNEEKRRLEGLKADMDGQLKTVPCDNPEQLGQKIADAEENDRRLRAAEETARTEKNAAAKRYEDAIAQNEVFAELEDRRVKLANLEARSEEMKISGQQLRLADAAERIREQYEAFTEANCRLSEAEERRKKAEKEYTDAEDAAAKAERSQERHEQIRPAYEEAKKSVALMENAYGIYSAMEEKQRNARNLETKYDKAEKAAKTAREQFRKADDLWDKADLRKHVAQDDASRLHALYRANIYGILASELEKGKPCPVCGSIHHDAPASVAAGEKVTDQMLDEADALVQRTAKEESAARKCRTELETARDKAAAAAAEAKIAAEGASAEYKAAAAQLLPGIANIRALEQKITALSYQMKQYEKSESTIAEALRTASETLAAKKQAFAIAAGDVSRKAEERNRAEESWRGALAAEGFAEESAYLAAAMDAVERNALGRKLTEYNTNCKTARAAFREQQEKVCGLDAPDLEMLEKSKADAEADWTKAKEARISLESRINSMQRMYETISVQWQNYQQDRSALDGNIDFLNKLNPKSGLSLQRYVLGIMLASITTAANQLLKSVHGGRYQLRRSNTSTSGNKTGLELNVFDSSNGECRSVKTLSGGEKFLVSLSLAIGLSTVVQTQSGGTKLEAMFIDEGFGSLDDESINDALDVLNGVRKGHGLVGIISHVDKLAGTIPTRIEVRKGTNGNYIHSIY